MPVSVALMRKLSEMDPSLREAFFLLLEEMERQRERLERQVTKDEFNELKAVVAELLASHQRAEARLERLEKAVAELTEAQKQAEARLTHLETTVAQLIEAQKQAEARLTHLETTVAQLIEAQKQAEARLTRLETTVAQLVEAQKRTEEEIRQLARRVDFLHERLEGLSDTVGYTLENRAYVALPRLLAQEGIQVEGRLIRKYVQIRKKTRQVNIWGYGRRNGIRVLILGEAKVRPSQKDVDRFVKMAQALEEQEGMLTVRLFVAHDFQPAVEAYLRELGILPIWSYELESA